MPVPSVLPLTLLSPLLASPVTPPQASKPMFKGPANKSAEMGFECPASSPGDDGNLLDGDGCDSTCSLEAGFVCSGGSPSSPDVCQQQVTLKISQLSLEPASSELTVLLSHPVSLSSKPLSLQTSRCSISNSLYPRTSCLTSTSSWRLLCSPPPVPSLSCSTPSPPSQTPQ